MQLIDGKATSAEIKKEIAKEVEQIKAAGGKTPHTAAMRQGTMVEAKPMLPAK